MRFALTKWYIDVVADDGNVAIAYWAAVRAAGARHAVGGVLWPRGDAPVERAFTLRSAPAPAWSGDHLRWQCRSLHLSADADRRIGPFDHRLFATPAGTLDWHCEAPLARVRLVRDGTVIEGDGYVERMALGIAPWAVPVSRFLWGRWTGPGRSLVWIVWEGPHPLRLAWLDGVLVPDAVPGTERVDLGARGSLSLDDHVVITDASVGEQLMPVAPLRPLVESRGPSPPGAVARERHPQGARTRRGQRVGHPRGGALARGPR